MIEKEVNHRKIYIKENPLSKRIIFLGIFKDEKEVLENVILELQNLDVQKEYSIVAFEVEDWDRDYSPWACEGVVENQMFLGKGRETLDWLEDCQKEFPLYEKYYVAGYSLAGLFALWCLYESNCFDGCACCSGSLWFEGWKEYIKTHHILKESNIYLSLGGKEEKTKNEKMAEIGTCTRYQNQILEKENLVCFHTLEMNSGGHFANQEKRLAKGIKWLLEH